MARAMALGADWCNAARGFMFALGCIQSMSCHTDRCPTGVATQDKTRSRALVVEDKTERVRSYQASMLHALAELYPELRRGELITGAHDKHWRQMWEMARADSFAPASS